MKRLPILALVLGGLFPVSAETEEEAVLPTAYPVSRYSAIWENSPFNREVVKPIGQTIQSSFAQSLVLEGLINDDKRGPVAYVRDTREDLSLVITQEKSTNPSNPYTVVSASLSRRPEETKVTITDGKETAEIGFVAATLTQAIAAPAPAPAASRPPAGREGRVPVTPPPGSISQPGGIPQPGGGQSGGGRVPGADAGVVMPEDPSVSPSLTPALDKLDSEPRRRRVPLPGN